MLDSKKKKFLIGSIIFLIIFSVFLFLSPGAKAFLSKLSLFSASLSASDKEKELENTAEDFKSRIANFSDKIDNISKELEILEKKLAELNKNLEEKLNQQNSEDKEVNSIQETKKEEKCSVDINKATAEELQKITGVGGVIAQRIIEARPFSSLSDLIRVNGIGQATLQKIIEQGCAYVAGSNSNSNSGSDYNSGSGGSGSRGGGSGGGGGGGNGSNDGGGNQSSFPTILISEVQINPTSERFIELYNPNNEAVRLEGWYIQRKTASGTSWNSLVSSTQFEGKIIQAQSHFLIARSQTFNSDILLTDLTLTENNVIRLRNPNQETVDLVGWGQAQESEGSPTQNPPTGKSIGRKWQEANQNYQDSNNNSADFEIQNATPKTRNQSPLPPPYLDVSPLSLNFEAQVNGPNPPSQFLTIRNSGGRDLNWSLSISEGVSWLSAFPVLGTLQTNSSLQVEVSVNITGLREGNYQETITIEGRDPENNQAQNSPQIISVNLTLAP
jgi:competence ComEA-like helix-hairpin-helix protein